MTLHLLALQSKTVIIPTKQSPPTARDTMVPFSILLNFFWGGPFVDVGEDLGLDGKRWVLEFDLRKKK